MIHNPDLDDDGEWEHESLLQDAVREWARGVWPPDESPPDVPHDVDMPPPFAMRSTGRRDPFPHLNREMAVSQFSAGWPSGVTPDEEVIVDPETGGRKARKLARFDLLPAEALWAVAEQFGRGAEKYEDNNWRKGYDWSLSFGAMQRHAWLFWSGEDLDRETHTLHLAAVAFHALALLQFGIDDLGTDDRPD